MRGRKPRPLTIAADDAPILQAVARSRHLAFFQVQHARIVLKNNSYFLVDNETPGGTFLNGQRINGRAPLKNGDKIQVGTAVLRFGERPKKK